MSTDATVAHLLALARECAHRRANEANWLGLKNALREALDMGEPVAEVKCWEEPRYERPPRQFYELTKLAVFETLPTGTHKLYLAPKAKP